MRWLRLNKYDEVRGDKRKTTEAYLTYGDGGFSCGRQRNSLIYLISIPIERQDPSITLTAWSIVFALRSGILIAAISSA